MLLISLKRFFGKGRSGHPNASQLPEQIISRIQGGDERLRQQFLAEHQSYVAEVASEICNKSIEPAKDAEYTLAFAAFADAIDRFDPQSDSSFFAYAEAVISDRLAEFVNRGDGLITQAVPVFKQPNKPQANQQQVYKQQADKQQEYKQHVDKQQADKQQEQKQHVDKQQEDKHKQHTDKQQDSPRIQERQSEIMDLQDVLGQFGIEWAQWADESPKTDELNQKLFSVSQILAGDPELMRQLLKERKLPMKQLAAATGQARNVLERHRHYIIAIAVLFYGPFPNLRNYLRMDRTSSVAEEGER